MSFNCYTNPLYSNRNNAYSIYSLPLKKMVPANTYGKFLNKNLIIFNIYRLFPKNKEDNAKLFEEISKIYLSLRII